MPVLLWMLNPIMQIKIFSLIIHSTTLCTWKLIGLIINLSRKDPSAILHSNWEDLHSSLQSRPALGELLGRKSLTHMCQRLYVY